MKVLMVLYPFREDHFSYLKKDSKSEFQVLWFEKKAEFTKEGLPLPVFFSEQYFWNDYTTPFSLLKKAKPDRLVLLEIIDQRQIALIAAAKKMGIPCFYLEHGSAGDRDTALKRSYSSANSRNWRTDLIKQKRNRKLIDILRVKLFFYSALFSMRSFRSFLLYLRLPFLMLKHSPNRALSLAVFDERIPDKCILFNRANLEEFVAYTPIPASQAELTGLPFFDSYFSGSTEQSDHIVYIEHPMFECGLLGWTREHHQKICETLYEVAVRRRMKIYVKLHPRSDASLWNNWRGSSPFFEIVQHGDFHKLYLTSRLVLGYSSSLLTGLLCARKNVVNLGWHPAPQIFGADFAAYGICHRSMLPGDLVRDLDNWLHHNLCIENKEKYLSFIRAFNDPFDGHASDRVIACITNA